MPYLRSDRRRLSPAPRGFVAMLCLSLAALPALAAGADGKKKASSADEGPSKQFEYQVLLQPQKFKTRAAGVAKFFAYLEDDIEGELKKKKFKYTKETGNNEKRVAVFLDTSGGDLKRARFALRYRRTLEKWDSRTKKWLEVKAEDSHANLTIKHNAVSEKVALREDLTPADAYVRGAENKGKWQSKLEWDYYQPGNKKCAYSVSLYGKHFRSCVGGLQDLPDMKAVGKLLPGLMKRLKLPETTKLTRRYEFRWTRDDIKLELGRKKCVGTLMLVYRTQEELDAGSSAPQKIEFSWRLKEKSLNKKSIANSETVRKMLWKGVWAVPADKRPPAGGVSDGDR